MHGSSASISSLRFSLSPALSSLLPAGLTVEQFRLEVNRIVLVAHSPHATAACPLCGELSTWVHSRYVRRSANLPWQGRIV